MPEKKQTEGRGAYEWVQALVCSVLTVVLIFTFAVRIVRVSGESMRETLQDQDMLVVLNNWLCGGYEQGDIVILQRDDFYGGEPIVKRVIATEGQTVDIDFDAGVVYVDGKGREHKLTCDDVVLSGGVKPRIEQAMAFYGSADRFYLVGDCERPGSIQSCTRSAFATASQI